MQSGLVEAFASSVVVYKQMKFICSQFAESSKTRKGDKSPSGI
jgi:hypothetical protein